MVIEHFAKPFPSKRKPSKCPTKEEKMEKEKQQQWGGEKAKGKRQGGSETFSKKKTISKFCFLRMPKL